MNSILSHSIPIKDIIYDLASQLNTPVEKNCDEYQLKIPTRFGEGFIRGIDFKDGLGFIVYDCTFLEDMEIQFIVDKVHPLKFLFCEKGNLTHRFENETTIHPLDVLQNIIVASSQKHGHILQFKAGLKTMLNSLEINRDLFIINMNCELKSLEAQLENLFRDTSAKTAFYHHGDYCIRMADLFIEINGFPKENFLRKIFLEGSALKILTLQILQYQDDISLDVNRTVLRKSELILVKKASSFIDKEILAFKTVQDLALHVGLNQNKLQNGFKDLYDRTVNGYVHDKRLDLANTLLNRTDYSISEIVYMVGLSSKSYFSKIFKDKYGISPSAVRMNGKKKK